MGGSGALLHGASSKGIKLACDERQQHAPWRAGQFKAAPGTSHEGEAPRRERAPGDHRVRDDGPHFVGLRGRVLGHLEGRASRDSFAGDADCHQAAASEQRCRRAASLGRQGAGDRLQGFWGPTFRGPFSGRDGVCRGRSTGVAPSGFAPVRCAASASRSGLPGDVMLRGRGRLGGVVMVRSPERASVGDVGNAALDPTPSSIVTGHRTTGSGQSRMFRVGEERHRAGRSAPRDRRPTHPLNLTL